MRLFHQELERQLEEQDAQLQRKMQEATEEMRREDYLSLKSFEGVNVRGTLYIDAWEYAKDEQSLISVRIENYDDKRIWESELGIEQTAWKSFYLYSEGKLNYVIEYIPKESQGQSAYTFKMFTFDEGGNQIVKLVSFDTDVSEYLKKAELLVSTIGGEVRYK